MRGDWKAGKANRTFNRCAQCGDVLFAPVWSEYVKERCIRHLWNCDTCGYAYESMVYLAAETTADHVVDDAA